MHPPPSPPPSRVYVSDLYYQLGVRGAVLTLIVGIGISAVIISQMVPTLTLENLSTSLLGLCVGLAFIWTLPLISIIHVLNLYPKITLTADGITLSYNHFWSFPIAWNDFVKIKNSKLPFSLGIYIYFKGGKWVHRMYGSLFQPAFLIDPRMPDVEMLLSAIERRSLY